MIYRSCVTALSHGLDTRRVRPARVAPRPTPTCGPVAGGTLLHITGRSLDDNSTATIPVGPANVPCELVARYEDGVLCLTAPLFKPAVQFV